MVLYDLVAAIFVFGCCIVLACFISLKTIYQTSNLHNAFGYICAAQSISEGIVGGCFLLWGAPMTAFFPELSQSFIGFTFGQIFLYFYFLTMWLHLCKSINRCFAIIFPIQYYKQFTTKVAKVFICFAMIVALASASSIFRFECNYYFNAALYKWKLRQYPGCWEMPFADQFVTFTVVICSVICDIITLAYLIVLKKKLQQSTNDRNDRKLFIQTCLSTICYTIFNMSFYYLSGFAETLRVQVIVKTTAWELFHFSNELIFIFFNLQRNTNASNVLKLAPFTNGKSATSAATIVNVNQR